jgi:predicted transcriptional regulator
VGATVVTDIQGDRELTPDEFSAFLKTMGFRTQQEAAEALGVDQSYISKLRTGRKTVLPGTSLMLLLRALLRIRTLEHRITALERSKLSPPGMPSDEAAV